MSDKEIYVGVWVNQSLGPTLGLTLTLPAFYGVALIAGLALLVRWAGSRFWGIVCFIFHHLDWNSGPHDGFYRQRQAILRSKLTETDFIWRMFEMSWAWKSQTASVRRSLPFAFFALLNIAVWLTAGIFSAKVAKTNSEGLAKGRCGWIETAANKDFGLWNESDWNTGDVLFVTSYHNYRNSLRYAQNCYTQSGSNFTSNFECQAHIVPSIASSMRDDAPCPFGSDACTGATFVIDSGLIDTRYHLGMNVRNEDRLQFRKSTTCAPIDMERYSTAFTTELIPGAEFLLYTGVMPNDTYKYYYLGPTFKYGMPLANFTFVETGTSIYNLALTYNFESRTAYAMNSVENGFQPDPDFNRTDADVTILTLNNRVAFTGEVNDPFYRASSRATTVTGLAEAWVANSPMTGLACMEQYQFCNPNDPAKCTRLGSLYEFDQIDPPAVLALGPKQVAQYRTLHFLLVAFRMNIVTQFLRHEILLANQLIYGSFGISTPLPDNQWRLEIQNIHNTSLAGIQRTVVEHAAASNFQVRPDLTLFDHFIDDTDPEMISLCRNQIVRTSRYTSFNMTGLLITVIFSLVIILTDVYLPSLVERFIKYRKVGTEQALTEWENDDILQLQRQLLEAKGVGPWQNKFGRVPVTVGWTADIKRPSSYPATVGSVSHESLEPLTYHRGLELGKVAQSRVKRSERYDSD